MPLLKIMRRNAINTNKMLCRVCIWNRYLQGMVTPKKPLIALSLWCKMDHSATTFSSCNFTGRYCECFDSKPLPWAFCQEYALTQYKNAAFREAAHARNLLINNVPDSTLSMVNGTPIYTVTYKPVTEWLWAILLLFWLTEHFSSTVNTCYIVRNVI